MARHKQKYLRKLNLAHRRANNGDIEKNSHQFLCKIYPLFKNWKFRLPNLLDNFLPEEIDWLLSVAANDNACTVGRRFIKFVARTGYEDQQQPELDEDGNPVSRRTTALHRAAKHRSFGAIHSLFKIYRRFDVNYIDEDGLTHFHVACQHGCVDVVDEFLELGQDPNCLVRATGDAPLHFAVRCIGDWNRRVTELLLRAGADPNLANAKGLTPLHVVCQSDADNFNLATMMFTNQRLPVRVDARDKYGNTPLHLALRNRGNKRLIGLLLSRGADPDLANRAGSTPLHVVCKRAKNHFDNWNDSLFKNHRPLRVDARDKKGRTPLQWAVANILPLMVGKLLALGADLSNFVFPDASYFGYRFKARSGQKASSGNFKLGLACAALACVDLLEGKGYELELEDALKIMRLFAEREMFANAADLAKPWYDRAKCLLGFASMSKCFQINSRSIHDLIRLPIREASKLVTCKKGLLTYSGVYVLDMCDKETRRACTAHLCEIMTRRFFRRWALDSFVRLTHRRLPILCCDMVIDGLMNEDLFSICLADAGESF